MDHILPIVLLLIGLAVGGGAVWLLLRAKIQHAYDRGKSEADAERIALAERLNAREQTIGGLDAKVQELERQIAEHRAAELKLQFAGRPTGDDPHPGTQAGRGEAGRS